MDQAVAVSEDSYITSKTRSSPDNKLKPKVRIIHIFSPEIIHTDAEHFRDLVQRLTGKPRRKGSSTATHRRKKKPTPPPLLPPPPPPSSSPTSSAHRETPPAVPKQEQLSPHSEELEKVNVDQFWGDQEDMMLIFHDHLGDLPPLPTSSSSSSSASSSSNSFQYMKELM